MDRRIAVLVLVTLVSCAIAGQGARDPGSRAASPDDRVDAGALHGPDGGSACVGSPLRAYDEAPGVLQRLFVELPVEGRTLPFFFDTGSEQTFRRADASPGADGAQVSPTTISCMSAGLAFSRRSVFAATPDGQAVGGVIGTDLLTVGGVLDLRIRDSLFVWSRAVPPMPPGTITLPSELIVSTDPYSRGKIVVEDVMLDGERVRLLLDTGSPHVVIVSKVPRPNEVVSESFDGTGARVKFSRSTIELAFGKGSTRRVTVDRAESFPTLEKVFSAIGGGEIAGVLGLGALGHERIVIAKDAVRFVL